MRSDPAPTAPYLGNSPAFVRVVAALALVAACRAEKGDAPVVAADLPRPGDVASEPNPLGFRGFRFALQDARLSEMVEGGDGNAERLCPTLPFASHSLPLSPLPPLCTRPHCQGSNAPIVPPPAQRALSNVQAIADAEFASGWAQYAGNATIVGELRVLPSIATALLHGLCSRALAEVSIPVQAAALGLVDGPCGTEGGHAAAQALLADPGADLWRVEPHPASCSVWEYDDGRIHHHFAAFRVLDPGDRRCPGHPQCTVHAELAPSHAVHV